MLGRKFVIWNDQMKPKHCFICGKVVERSDSWKEDYCHSHEGTGARGCSSSVDWGVIMERAEQGYISLSL